MWRLRGVLRRRWHLAAATLLTLAVTALVARPWTPAGVTAPPPTDTDTATAAVTAAAAADDEGLEFYGAARNLFSSDSRRAPAHAAASPPTPTAAAVGTPRPRTFERYDLELERVNATEAAPLTADWLRGQERLYAERRRRLRRACDRRHVRLADSSTARSVLADLARTPDGPVETIKATHFTVVPPLKTMTCLVNKAASTSLLGTFLKLTGHGVPVFSSMASPHSIAKVLHPTKAGQFELAKKQYFKFMFVRHPLERLISAYEDKVVRADHPSLLYLRKTIFSVHEDIYIRRRVYELLRAGGNDTDILARYDADVASYRADVASRNGVPSFAEFLDFVLSKEPTGDSFDSHWTPYWKQCSPCHIDYDVIGTLETGEDDFKYVWSRMGIYDTVKIPRQNALRRGASPLAGRVRRYLGGVSAATVARFGDSFGLDFEMFGYDWAAMLVASGHCSAGRPCPLPWEVALT